MRVEVNLHIVLHHRLIPAGGGGESCSPDDVGGRIRMVDGSYLRAALPTMRDTDYRFQFRAFQLTAVYPYHLLSLVYSSRHLQFSFSGNSHHTPVTSPAIITRPPSLQEPHFFLLSYFLPIAKKTPEQHISLNYHDSRERNQLQGLLQGRLR